VAGASASAGIAATGGAASPGGALPPSGAASALPPVPVHGAYFGVDPNFKTGDTPAATQPRTTVGELSLLQGQIGRPVSIVSFYIGWEQSPPLPGMAGVAAQGSIPLVSWHCGPLDTSVANGQFDGLIRNEAEAFKAYGRPVFLRWFWEMNLPNVPGHAACLGAGDLQTQEQEYITAYQRIWTIFHDAGADNVAFVWGPSAAASAPTATGFYPGNQYVDWIGFDLYDRAGKGTFPTVFHITYPTYANATYADKPMIITETGAPEDGPGMGSPTQAQWIQEIQSSLPTEFPEVHGVVYVDASDSAGDYVLGGTGLAAFATLARTQYFAQVVRGA
jgi:hypothetical protein